MTRKERVLSYVHGLLASGGSRRANLEGAASATAAADADLPLPDPLETWLGEVEGLPDLSEAHLVRLESIVINDGRRPVFDIVASSFADLPAPWQPVNLQRPLFERRIRGVGRIDLVGHPSRAIGGTGFLCGDRLVMTNWHVAQLFASPTATGAATLKFLPGRGAVLDFAQEVGSPATMPFEVEAPLIRLRDWDLALVRLRDHPAGVQALPSADGPPASLEDGIATVVGYPLKESSNKEEGKLFRNIFGKKRLTPGTLRGMQDEATHNVRGALGHDCTSLGGNSGSPVIDVASGLVVGLHFLGIALEMNFAVPLWKLATRPELRDAGVLFAPPGIA